MMQQETNAFGADKVTRYKWGLHDAPGRLCQVHKSKIVFDDRYQREIAKAKVVAIARDWSWLALGVITVAERDGELYAVDGMHRVSAARLRSDIQELPCVVFQSDGMQSEAQGFIRANTNRKPITTAQSHRARVVAGDETAVFVQSIIEKAGLVVSGNNTGPGRVKCMGLMHKLARSNRDALLRVWPLICEVSEGHPINEKIVDGLVYLVANASHDINEKRWRSRITNLGYSGLKSAAEGASAYYAKGGARVYADGMAQAINKGLQYKLGISND